MEKIIFKFFIFCFLSVIIFNVKAQKRKNPSEVNSSVVYILPKTVIDLDLLAKKTIFKSGPFGQYAEKYLGIKNVQRSNSQKWTIAKMSFSEHAEIDASKSFELVSNKNYISNMISLTKEGFIKGFNLKNTESKHIYSHQEYNGLEDIKTNQYGSFCVDRILNFTKDTIYKVVETDSTFVRVPVLETKVSSKTMEEKAAEAAHQIFKLRKRRFKILTANYEILPPDGKAYAVIVEELKILEEKYMSLFVGKTYTQYKKFKFSYTPKQGVSSGVFFKFSSYKGAMPASSAVGEPIRINIKATNIKTNVKNGNPGKSVFYRIPVQANVLVFKGEKIFLNHTYLISQLGATASYPVDILLNEEYSIEYYPNYGSIKRIYKNK